VLRILGASQEGLTLQELSRTLGASPATMHRLLAVLSQEDFVVRATGTRRYSLGPSIFALAPSGRPIATVARSHLEALRASTGETAFLTELIGSRPVCVALVESHRPLRLFVRVGQQLPLHAAASSRAILAFTDDARLEAMLADQELPRYTDETPFTLDEVKQRLSDVRLRGYDVCNEELEPNVWAVGAPIAASDGSVTASVTVAGPLDRLDAAVREAIIDEVTRAGAAISAVLGYRGAADIRKSPAPAGGADAA
jgi:DNA-binding IclR family transcriptional regulator